MEANTPRRVRQLLFGLGLLGSLWLVAVWILYPGYLLLTLPVSPTKVRPTPLPSSAVLYKLDIYHQVMASPFYRRYAQARAASLLSQHVHTSRIERSFRNVLLERDLSAWFATQRRWESLLQHLERQFPGFHLEAYRAYLYLQAGQLQRLKAWGDKLPAKIPQQRQTTLLRVWLGHAAFFGGWPQRAQIHYKLALQAYQRHPAWDRRTRHNWRLPAELTTTLYHMGLLALHQGQPRLALSHFQHMIRRWKQLRRKHHTMPLWYLAQLWSAQACFALKDPTCAQKHLQKASQFAKDPTLRLLAQSRLPSLQDAALTTVIASHRTHSLSYADSALIARLHKALHHLQRGQAIPGYRHLLHVTQTLQRRPWPPTLGMLQRRNTESIRYIPLAPIMYTALLQAVAKVPLPQTATTQPAATRPSTTQPTATQSSSPSGKLTPGQLTSGQLTSGQLTQRQQVIRDLRMYRVLSQLKLYDWHAATLALHKLRQQYPRFAAPLLYLGMLALHQGQSRQAYGWLSQYHKSRNNQVSLLYLFYAATLTNPQQARALLPVCQQKKIRASICQRLRDILARKSLGKKAQKAQYWWRVLGAQGLLATYDPTLGRSSHYWRVYPTLQRNAQAKHLLRDMHISHQLHRHSLATWLGRYRYLAQLFPHQKQEYLRRLRYIQSFYHRFPHQWYLLDRVMYSNQWGLMALGLY